MREAEGTKADDIVAESIQVVHFGLGVWLRRGRGRERLEGCRVFAVNRDPSGVSTDFRVGYAWERAHLPGTPS